MGEFAVHLKRAIEARGLKQIEAAQLLGVPQSLVSQYINGHREPTFGNAIKIAAALGVSLDELAGGGTGRGGAVVTPWGEWGKQLRAAYRRDPDVVTSAVRAAWPKPTATAILAWLKEV